MLFIIRANICDAVKWNSEFNETNICLSFYRHLFLWSLFVSSRTIYYKFERSITSWDWLTQLQIINKRTKERTQRRKERKKIEYIFFHFVNALGMCVRVSACCVQIDDQVTRLPLFSTNRSIFRLIEIEWILLLKFARFTKRDNCQ